MKVLIFSVLLILSFLMGARVLASAGWVTGKFNQAYDFDGEFYVDAGDVYNSVKTAAFWIKGTHVGTVLDFNGSEYISIINNTVSATGFTATIYVDGVAGTTVDSDWHYVVLTTDSSVNASAVKFGSVFLNSLLGAMDDVKFYSYALSAREINEKYRQGSPSLALGGTVDGSLYVMNSGSVGIGTTAPSSKLTVSGGGLAVSSAGAATTTISSATSTFAHGLIVDTNSLYVMADTNRVGIATTSPDTKLDVWGSFQVATSSGKLLYVDYGTGYVGVATTTPAYQLSVQGHCVTGDSKLRRRRKKKNGQKPSPDKKAKQINEDDDYIYEEIAIKDIQAGDEIATLDEKTGKIVYQKVEALWDMGEKPIYKLTTKSGKTIRTTAEHPYYVNQAANIFAEEQLKAGLFIDNANLFYAQRKAGWKVDLNKLVKLFQSVKLQLAHLHIALPKKSDYSHKQTESFIDKIKHSISIKAKPLKYIASGGGVIKKGDVDVDLSVDAINQLDNLDLFLIASGDSDYLALRDYLLKRNKKVVFFGFKNNIAYELKKGKYITFESIKQEVELLEKKTTPEYDLGRVLLKLLYSKQNNLSSPVAQNGVWSKAAHLQKGQQIAVESKRGEVVWEEITGIEVLPKEQVYDITVQNTHNFVANSIIAHNTYISATTTINSDLKVGDSDLFVNTASSRVGIATTSPDTKLDVWGSFQVATSSGKLLYVDYSTGYTGIGATSTLSHQLTVAGTSYFGSNLTVGTSTALFVDSGNGRVGISDATPSAKLDISEDRTSGTIMQLSYQSAKTLAGNVIGLDLNLNTNVTPGSYDITGINLALPSTGTGEQTFLKFLEGSTTLYDFDKTTAQFNLPASFNSAGDVSMAYDLLFSNNSAAYIKFAGPGYIQTNSASGNYDLTLSAANLGAVIVDDSLEITATTTLSMVWSASTTVAFTIDSETNSTSTPSAGLFRIITDVNSDENTVFQIMADGSLGVGAAGPDRRVDVYDPANPQLRLTQANASQYVDFESDAAGDLTITPSGDSITIPDDNFYICISDACPAVGTLTGTGNLQVESDLFVGGNLALGNASSTSVKFTGYKLAGATSTNITGISGNNPVIRKAKAYIEDDPAVNATSTLCRLSFYNADSMTEDELITAFYFTLTYTELNGGESGSSAYADVDSTTGLVKYDLVRFLDGTAENQRITGNVTSTTAFAMTALAGAHADDSGVVRVAEITELFQLYDADASNEIHMKLETFEDAFDVMIDIVVELEIQ